jgi:peptidoglycan/xylan/chitin deacetylase (PgdA/CDA1 family)
MEGFKRSIRFFISAFVWLYDRLIHFGARITGLKANQDWIVICYHSIPAQQRERFSRQMDALLRWAVPAVADEPAGGNGGRRRVTVTFDDGFVSYVDNALPELMKRRIPSILFVPSRWLGRQADWITRENAGRQLESVLTEDRLKELSRNPLVTIGSHCKTHRDLCRLEEEEAADEVIQSRKELQSITGKEIDTLSFPFGSYRPSHVQSARIAGYRRVFSVQPIPVREGNEFVMGRAPVEPEDCLVEFYLKVAGAYRWLPAVTALKAKIRSQIR